MTKLELLQSYTSVQKRDTWSNTGASVLSITDRYINQEFLFRLNSPTSPLNGAIFFNSNIEGYMLPSAFNWDNFNLNNPSDNTGMIIDTTNSIINPFLRVVLTEPEFTALIPTPVDTSWIPYTEPALDLPVQISDIELNKVLIDIGVPFISIDELEYNKEQILSLMIQPAMDTYFRYFPIARTYTFGMFNPQFEIPMPEGSVSVLSAATIPGLQGTGQPTQGYISPMYFWMDEVVLNVSSASPLGYSANGRVKRGFKPNQDMSVLIMERAVRSGMTNYMRRKRIKTYIENRIVKGFCTERATLEIVFGYSSTNWEDIPVNMQPQVRDLAKAYVLRAFGQLRMQARSDIAGTLNYQDFLTRADKLEQETIELWKNSTKSVVIRS